MVAKQQAPIHTESDEYCLGFNMKVNVIMFEHKLHKVYMYTSIALGIAAWPQTSFQANYHVYSHPRPVYNVHVSVPLTTGINGRPPICWLRQQTSMVDLQSIDYDKRPTFEEGLNLFLDTLG